MRSRTRVLRLIFYAVFAAAFTATFYGVFGGGPRQAASSPNVNMAISPRLGYKHLGAIPATLVPHAADPPTHKRLVFIGDVHGMHTELQALLRKLRYDASTDHLVFTGDVVTKGPDSLKVVEFARRANASCVRGNQDDRVLLHYRNRVSGTQDSLSDDEDDTTASTVSPSEKRIRADKRLARKMTRAQAKWLNSCPVILTAAAVNGLGNVAVVHAGLVHGVGLAQQDPMSVMTMRSIDGRLRVPSSESGGTHWAHVWNRHERSAGEPTTVIYGHYAKRGLDIRPLTKG